MLKIVWLWGLFTLWWWWWCGYWLLGNFRTFGSLSFNGNWEAERVGAEVEVVWVVFLTTEIRQGFYECPWKCSACWLFTTFMGALPSLVFYYKTFSKLHQSWKNSIVNIQVLTMQILLSFSSECVFSVIMWKLLIDRFTCHILELVSLLLLGA